MNKLIVICDRTRHGVWFEGICGAVATPGKFVDPVTLPIEETLITRVHALSGFAFSPWGIGAHFNHNQIQHSCPMVLWIVPGIPVLHWIARVEQMDKRGIPPSGSLRLVSNPGQPGAMQGGLSSLANSSHVDLNSLGLPDEHGGWTVGGHLGVLAQGEGMLAVRLQGICQNVRVLWSAISQAHPE